MGSHDEKAYFVGSTSRTTLYVSTDNAVSISTMAAKGANFATAYRSIYDDKIYGVGVKSSKGYEVRQADTNGATSIYKPTLKSSSGSISGIMMGNDKKPKAKLSWGKAMMAVVFALCIEIVLYAEAAMWIKGDLSALYALIGVPAAMVGTFWAYASKSKAENTEGRITYAMAMQQDDQNAPPDTDSDTEDEVADADFKKAWDDSREEYRLIGEMISLRTEEKSSCKHPLDTIQ